jgi:hypothetical protein
VAALTRRDELDGDEINNRFSWQDHTNCRGADQDLFFFFPKRGASTRKARAMMCSLRSESRVPRICSHPGRTFRDLGRPLGARTPQDPRATMRWARRRIGRSRLSAASAGFEIAFLSIRRSAEVLSSTGKYLIAVWRGAYLDVDLSDGHRRPT